MHRCIVSLVYTVTCLFVGRPIEGGDFLSLRILRVSQKIYDSIRTLQMIAVLLGRRSIHHGYVLKCLKLVRRHTTHAGAGTEITQPEQTCIVVTSSGESTQTRRIEGEITQRYSKCRWHFRKRRQKFHSMEQG